MHDHQLGSICSLTCRFSCRCRRSTAGYLSRRAGSTMSSRRLDRMGLESFIVECLSARGISTAKDLLETSPLALMVYLDLSLADANKIISHVSSKIAFARNSTALELLRARSQQNLYLRTGIKELDTAMRGGLNIGTISEICGPPGVGKTQFCIGCCVQAVVMSNSSSPSDTSSALKKRGGVVYIDTELKFDSMRLIDVAISSYPEIYSAEYSVDAPHQIDKFLKSVKILQPGSCKELLRCIEDMQSFLIEEGVTLIVLDSIAALARKEGLNEIDKEQFIIGQAASLKNLAELCGCCVLVTNQITIDALRDQSTRERDSNNNDPLGDRIIDIGGVYRPTLGPTWHHCVSTRLTMYVSRASEWGVGGEGRGTYDDGVRVITLSKSPIAGPFKIPFEIVQGGVQARTALIVRT